MSAAQRLRAAGPLLVLLLLALALRAPDFGNPIVHVDEQYYLLVGDRMWHGALPYIDLWDRKPIGLFLIYAATRVLPGDGIIGYQLVALVFAVLTAWAIGHAGRRLGANAAGALIAGAAYLVWLPLLSGRAGQTPVFFNLFMAIGGGLMLRLPELAQRRDARAIVVSGATACLLAGLGIQTKYTPAVEGALFGAMHLYYLNRAGAKPGVIVAAGLLWVLLGLTPTLAAAGFYWHLGRVAFAAFWYDNFASIFARAHYSYPIDLTLRRLAGIGAQLLLLAICAAATFQRYRARAGVRLAAAWIGAALVPFVAMGVFFDDYALPLLPPLLTLSAPTFARHRRIALAIVAAGLGVFTVEAAIRPDDVSGVRALAAVVKANSGHECPYVFIGDAIVYQLADACIPTAYAFPSTLAYAPEQGATGIDEAGEVRRILSHRPPVIVTASQPLAEWNAQSHAAVSAALARDYRPVFSAPRGSYRALVYLRNDRALVRSPHAPRE